MAKSASLAAPPSKGFAQRKKMLILTTMALPGAIWLLLIRYLPMAGIVLAFKNYRIYPKAPTFINNIIHSPWTGFKNFEFLFATTEAGIIIRNTLGYNIFFIIFGTIISVAFAVILNEITSKIMAKSYQTMMFFPYFLSWIVVSYFVLAFLHPQNGMLVHWQTNLGYTPTDWYNDAKPWPYIIIIAHMWKNVGYTCILYLAAVTGIDATQYEAARIDGASKFQQVLYVTLPHLRTMVIILFIMNVGRIFNADFGLFFSVPKNSGPLFPVTNVIDTYVYRALVNTGDIGMSAAAGLFQNVVGFVCIMIANGIVRKVDPDSSMF